MKTKIALLMTMILAIPVLCAFAMAHSEDEALLEDRVESSVSFKRESPAVSVSTDGPVSGDFDTPALVDPEERYEYYVEKTDGSETAIYIFLDQMNDEAADIEEYGALYVTENLDLNSEGKPSIKMKMSIQNSPYGKVIVGEQQMLWMKITAYDIGAWSFVYDGESVERGEGFRKEEIDSICESYHFPYSRLDTLNGVRQDENGYSYFLIKSEENQSFEFVVGENMRIVQLRVYKENDVGKLALTSYVDYDVGPAWEIPQAVLDAMGEVLTPVDE